MRYYVSRTFLWNIHSYVHIHNSKGAAHILFGVLLLGVHSMQTCWSDMVTLYIIFLFFYTFYIYLFILFISHPSFLNNTILVFSGHTRLSIFFLMHPLYLLLFSYYEKKSLSPCLMFNMVEFLEQYTLPLPSCFHLPFCYIFAGKRQLLLIGPLKP